MSIVKFDYRVLDRKEVDQAIRDKKAQHLCSGNNFEDFYFLDNSIVATWWDRPEDQFFRGASAGELKLDDFLAELNNITGISAEEKNNIANIISENEAAIRERERNRDVSETTNSIDALLDSLIKRIKHLEELGIKNEWLISRDGTTVLETSKEDVRSIGK